MHPFFAVNPRVMFVTRANFYSLIDVLLVHGINPGFKAENLAKYGDTVGHLVTAMTTPWSQLSEDQQKLAQESYQGLRSGVDRGIWRMLPLKLNEGTWAKLESFPSLAHVIISLIVAMNKNYKTSKALTNHLFRGGCLVAADRDEHNSLDNIWVTKSIKATKESPMTKNRIPNWNVLLAVSPASLSAGGQGVFVSITHAAALFCYPTRNDIDHKPYNKRKNDLREWDPDKTLNDKLIDYNPKTMTNDDNGGDDKDDVKSKESESISIDPRGAFIEFQRIAEMVMEMTAEPVPSQHVPTLEQTSILELGNKLGEVVAKVQINQLMQSIVR